MEAEKELGEMLDSVNSINDEFVNEFFSNEEVDYSNDAEPTDDVSEEDVETVKGEEQETNDEAYFDTEELDKNENDETLEENKEEQEETEEVSNEEEQEETSIAEQFNMFTSMPKEESLDDFNIDGDDIVSSEDIDKQIEEDAPLDLNFDYDKLKEEMDESEEQEEKREEFKELSPDELMNLLEKTNDSEEFFDTIEGLNDK